MDEDFYKPIIINGAFSNNYIQYIKVEEIKTKY